MGYNMNYGLLYKQYYSTLDIFSIIYITGSFLILILSHSPILSTLFFIHPLFYLLSHSPSVT